VSRREEIPQDWALRAQLNVIAGNEPPTSVYELRPLNPVVRQEFLPVREIDRAAERVAQLSERHEVYLGAAPRTEHRGTADSVARVWTLWADLDGRDALLRLRDFRPLPALVIRSGSDASVHAYWPLKEALDPSWAQRANRRLALALGADPASTDPARILRPCGSRNHKHDPPRRVLCTRLELDVFTWDQVVGSLPDDRSYVAPPRPVGERREVGDSSRALDGLVRTVAEGQPGERNRRLFWAACRAHDGSEAGTLDLATALPELRAAARHVGLAEIEVERTLTSAFRTEGKLPV
jgi:hypothetical protein